MDTNNSPRVLTHDEQKAADAAFAGRPFNPAWSQSAKLVYEGLARALPSKPEEDVVLPPPKIHAEEVSRPNENELPTIVDATQKSPVTEPDGLPASSVDARAKRLIVNRQEAIEAGALIDVTPDAQKLGLIFPVTVTRPLWEVGIAPTQALSDEEKANRLRDVLMAFRLRLSSLVTISPLIDFPAMLAFPPGAVPQPVPLFALVQPDTRYQATVTLLLPNEVATTIIPMN
ncbi:MAG: hypothetical protein EWM72_00316 [Nitrospira sp.]|nr:MAG: hypothetical protein EWM72_00316 [Nitrospira sp.]